MRAYVSIRGSRSPRRVDRDASPPPPKIARNARYPLASLTIETERGKRTYELNFIAPHGEDGKPRGADEVIVQLYLRMPDAADDRRIWSETI